MDKLVVTFTLSDPDETNANAQLSIHVAADSVDGKVKDVEPIDETITVPWELGCEFMRGGIKSYASLRSLSGMFSELREYFKED